jgi:glycosyltransferase involved in cell wall biosynthesis
MSKTAGLVIATVTPATGATGVQTHFNAFLDYLRTQGLTATLVTPRSYKKLVALGVFSIRAVVAPLSPSFDVWWFERWHFVFLKLALRRVLKKAGPVVIYAQCPLSAKAALAARVGPEQRVVMAAHFNVSTAEEWSASRGLSRDGSVYRKIQEREQQVLPSLDGIIYVSSFARKIIEDAIPGARAVPSLVLPNFVAAIADQPPGEVTNDLVTIGTLETRKNQGYLIRVLAEAKRLGKTYGLTLVGHGPLRSDLESLARSEGVREQLLFLGFKDNARRFLSGHRVYVHGALVENCPIVLIEAMASGLPVCAAPTGGIPDLFDDGREGLYWPLDNPAEGARKLIALMEDPSLYSRMSEAATRRFHERFESSSIAGRLLAFLTRH